MNSSSRIVILDQESNPIINQILFDLRHGDRQRNREHFRRNLYFLGYLMAYEAAKGMLTHPEVVTTPFGQATQNLLSCPPAIIGILRASVPMWLGALDALSAAEAGLVAISRKEETFDKETGHLEVQTGYLSLPEIEDKLVLIVDPMIAAGNSIMELLRLLEERGNTGETLVLSAVASPVGVERISTAFPNVRFLTASLDEGINEQAFIVPGLGDAGDLAFGVPVEV